MFKKIKGCQLRTVSNPFLNYLFFIESSLCLSFQIEVLFLASTYGYKMNGATFEITGRFIQFANRVATVVPNT